MKTYKLKKNVSIFLRRCDNKLYIITNSKRVWKFTETDIIRKCTDARPFFDIACVGEYNGVSIEAFHAFTKDIIELS